MRAAAALLFVTLFAEGQCIAPLRVPVGPRSIQPQCSFGSGGAIAASGGHVIGAWMTWRTIGFGGIAGETFGGALDPRGRLRAPEHVQFNHFPSVPSLATNGRQSLLAWTARFGVAYAQFIGGAGPVQLTQRATVVRPPRAIWNGRDWVVVAHEGSDVVAIRLADDGTVLGRSVIAAGASLADANASWVVVETAAGFEIVTPAARHPLPMIPPQAAVALGPDLVAWHGGAVGAQRLDAAGAPAGAAIVLDDDAQSLKRIAAAGEVVLWNDSLTLRGARIGGGGTVAPLQPAQDILYGAAVTSEGIVALVTGGCGVVSSLFLPRGAVAFEPPEIVSRAAVPQRPEALVVTPRGRDVYWSESRLHVNTGVLLLTRTVDGVVHPPLELSLPGRYPIRLAATPEAAAWLEYPSTPGPILIRLLRHGAAPVTLDEAPAGDVAVAAFGGEVFVFTTEDRDLWMRRVRADGTVERRLVLANIRASGLHAAATTDGEIVVSWFEGDQPENGWRLHVRDGSATRVFPLPAGPIGGQMVAGREPMVFWDAWEGELRLRALFPRSGVQAVIERPSGNAVVAAEPQPDGTFVLASVQRLYATEVETFTVAPSGTVTPREQLCFAGIASRLALRNGTVDSLLMTENGALFLVRRPLAKQRSVR